VRVIVNATDLDRFESMIAGNPSHVRPESRLQFLGNPFLAVLRAEDQMNAIAGV
jgi:hypothetical protein